MARHVLSLGLSLSLAYVALAFTPLSEQTFHYPDQIPYQVDTDPTGRGPQYGYTKCNSTTEGPNSICQLAMLNHIDDFCLWSSPDKNETIGDVEAKTVAYCTQPGHGTRIMPPGTLTAVQVLRAPSYILFTGHINQVNVDLQSNDYGGELDPFGADLRGNPLGSLVYSNGFPSNNGNNNTYQQVHHWHNFMGSNIFCFKICDDAVANSGVFCNNVFDRTGCAFVAPAAYPTDVFEVCESDNMDPVGVYVTNGVTSTYKQPGEGTEITSLPSIRTPASSSCTTYDSSLLYAAAASHFTSSATSPTGTSSPSGSGSGSGSKVTTTTSGKPGGSTTTPTSSKSNPSGAADRRVNVTNLMAVGIGMGPFVAIAASIVAGFGAILAGL